NGTHALAPDDIATIYDIAPLYQAGIDGSGQTIAIAGAGSMNVADLAAFRARFNLPPKVPQSIVVPGFVAPGPNTGAFTETALDLEWAGAVARNADLIFVYAPSPFTAASYAVDQNLAPVLSLSYSSCELLESPASLVFFQQIAQQANAQGMTWVNSSGDAGAAGCDPNSYVLAQNGLAARFPASIPEITAVGGTQFDEAAGRGNYWSVQNSPNSASALSYIPERAWNESASAGGLVAGGGGASVIYPKPVWQTGPAVPADGARDLPDVSLTAALHDGYSINVLGLSVTVGGTSASAPVFAGILALLNHYLQSTGAQAQSRLGNVNPVLYQLGQNSPGAFHDITAGGNAVPCAIGSPDCASGALGFSAASGYDLATGLGSPEVFNLVHQWSAQVPNNSLVVISSSQNPVNQQAPDRNGIRWKVTLTLTEEGGVPTTLTGFTINGASAFNTYFAQPSLPALGSLAATVGFATLNVPTAVVFGFTGIDASGAQWSQTVSIPFIAAPVTPTITGVANGFSYDIAYAPGMFLAVFGANLAPAPQQTAAVPLEYYFGGVTAAVNGYACPIYYVSPNQVNLQVPYEVLAGPATLFISNASGTASYPLQISAAAPGIAQDGSKNLVPNASGNRGQTYTLFLTGYGLVSPRVPDGATPQGLVAPAPLLGASVTIGGVSAPAQYVGIPSWAVGMVQINFQVPADTPLGAQQVVVTVGTASSSPVNFTVLQ
ncbi:MAG: hypothetical protein JO307_21215, partial [Bryobacterales bacterium]|nr:hypothetical protein [Bryobacterales bacterium]